jgi:hypothetical protein
MLGARSSSRWIESFFLCVFFATRLVAQGASLIPLVGFFFGALSLGATGALWLEHRSRGAAV